MDLPKILAELRAQQQHLDEAIVVLERLVAGKMGKRRGRPPKWLATVKTETKKQPQTKVTGTPRLVSDEKKPDRPK